MISKKHYYNKLTNAQNQSIMEYLLDNGGELLEKNGHYDFHDDNYDGRVIFCDFNFIWYDAYESGFYLGSKQVFISFNEQYGERFIKTSDEEPIPLDASSFDKLWDIIIGVEIIKNRFLGT